MDQVKERRVSIHLYIDEDLIKKARERCLNLSAFLRKSLREEFREELKPY